LLDLYPGESINIYTPGAPSAKSPGLHSQPAGFAQNAVNIESINVPAGHAAPGIHVKPGASGIILSGSGDARIIGHSGVELLTGNAGNDTIKGAGGSGTIISGGGANTIRPGGGNFVIDSGGAADTVYAGGGVDDVEARGSATVVGASGFLIFTDKGTTSSEFRVVAGSGTTEAYSGLGSDTFVGGSGTSYFEDAHTAGAASGIDVIIHAGKAGTDIISGFSSSDSDIVHMHGFSGLSGANVTVLGGNSFIDLQGTKLEFVGVTSLTVTSNTIT